MPHRLLRRLLGAVALLCLVVGLWLALAQPWITAVTQPHARHGALWRASLPGLDLGLDAYPAAPAQYGYVELWAYPYDADDIRPLLHLFGAPALPLDRPRRPAPPAAPNTPLPPQDPPIRL